MLDTAQNCVQDPNAAFLAIVAQFISQLKATGVAAFLIECVKNSDARIFAFVSVERPWFTRFLALLAAVLTSIGVHYTYQNGDLTIHGLTSITFILFLWHVAVNYMFQKAWWKLVVGRIFQGGV